MSAAHDRATAVAQLRSAARGRRPLGVVSVPDARGAATPLRRSPRGVSASVRWKYSNLAFAIAGLVVEKVSGQSYASYIQTNILDPLDMRDSSIDQNVPGLATPYGRRRPDGSREVIPFVDARGMAAATGLTSTVNDLAKFISAQFRRGPRGGAQIVSSGSWREMLRVRSVEENWTSGTGLGFDIMRVKDRT